MNLVVGGWILFHPSHLLAWVFSSLSGEPRLVHTLCGGTYTRRTLPIAFSPQLMLRGAGNSVLCFLLGRSNVVRGPPPPPGRHSKPVFPFGRSHPSIFYLYKPQTAKHCLVNTPLLAPPALGLRPRPSLPRRSLGKVLGADGLSSCMFEVCREAVSPNIASKITPQPSENRRGLSHLEGSTRF